MIHDIPVDPVTLMYMNEGRLTFHQMDNLNICLQEGDVVHFSTDSKHPRYPAPETVTGGVLIVLNRYMPANWITFGFVHLKTEESIMSWGMSFSKGNSSHGLKDWQIKGYDSEDDFIRDQEITSLLSGLRRDRRSVQRDKRITELELERVDIHARKKTTQEIN